MMSKIYVANIPKWYNELSIISSFYEKEYERFFRMCINKIFEDYHTINFKMDIVDGDNTQRPDLLVLKKDYSEYWIIEAELVNHDEKHILKQGKTFKNGELKNYYKAAEYICKKANEELNGIELDKAKVYKLIKDKTQEVLVVIDREFPGLKSSLDKLDVKLCLFEIYKANDSHLSFRISGEYPISIVSETPCNFQDDTSDLLKIHEPGFLDDLESEDDDILNISFNGVVTSWREVRKDGDAFLLFRGEHRKVPPNNDYILSKDNLNQLYLRVY